MRTELCSGQQRKRSNDPSGAKNSALIAQSTVFCFALSAMVVALCGSVEAQQAKVHRVGILLSASAGEFMREAFVQGLRDLGYVEGKNIELIERSPEGKLARLPALAAELVSLKVDVIVASSTTASEAAKNATATVPIVMTNVTDPVATGLVTSYARPGGNITGLSNMNAEYAGKRLELLKETNPKVSRVAVLWNSANSGTALNFKQTQSAAQGLHIRLQSLDIQSVNDLERAFEAVIKERAHGLVPLSSPIVNIHYRRIVEFAAKSRLTAIYDRRDFVEGGGLMSYAPNQAEISRRAATYVDKILKGAKPAELPVERPTKFEFAINLKTAKSLNLTISQSVLFRADKVIK
jgi:putative ABC transport system substrate-binding protein